MIEEARKYLVINKDTGEKISRVIWANEETGRYRQFLTDKNGKLIVGEKPIRVLSKIFKGNIALVRKDASV